MLLKWNLKTPKVIFWHFKAPHIPSKKNWRPPQFLLHPLPSNLNCDWSLNNDLWRTTWTDYYNYHRFYSWPLDKLTNKKLSEKNRETGKVNVLLKTLQLLAFERTKSKKSLKTKMLLPPLGLLCPHRCSSALLGNPQLTSKDQLQLLEICRDIQ